MNVSAINNISFGKKRPEGKVVWVQICKNSAKSPKSTNSEANIDTYRSNTNSSNKKGIKDKTLDALDTFCDTVSDLLGE